MTTSTTWTPRYTVAKADGVGGEPITAGEPCLVVRAQDVLAPFIIQAYIDRYRSYLGEKSVDGAVLADLLAHKEAVIVWQAEHRDRVKFADR